MKNARLVVAIAVVSLAVSTHAQQPSVFQAEINVVPVDLVVIDQEGRPVSGLQAADFHVTVDGRPRKVVTAQFLSSATSASTPRPDAARKAGWDIDAAFESVYIGNERATGIQAAPSRTVVIAIDQSGFQVAAGRNAANAARGLLDMLHPNDRVGLAVFPPPGTNLRPTRDHERVRQALSRITGASEPFPRTDIVLSVTDALTWASGDSMSKDRVVQNSCTVLAAATCQQELDRAASEITSYAQRQSLITLRGLSDVIREATLDGSPAAIVVVSTGLYAGGRAVWLGVDDEVRALGRVAAAAHASIYALYVESGFLDRDSMDRTRMGGFSTGDGDLRLEGLEQLVGSSGGIVTRVSGGSEAGFRRVSLELSAYYLLGIEGLAADHDGERHRLRVRVDRPGVTVRSREDLYVPAARKLTGDEAVLEALKAPDLERALPIRASTQMMREPGTDKVRLVISANIDHGVKAPGAVRVGYIIRGAGAAATSGVSDVQASKLPVVGTGADASLSYVETAQLTPGRYLLRLAAMEDGASRLGSVEQVIDATLVGGEAVLLSDLLLVDPPRSVKERFTPVADGRMTGDEIEAFLEVYPGPGQTVRTVAFDISDTPGGPAIVGGSVGLEKRDDGRLVAGAKLELGALPAGVYMLNARVLGREEALLGRVSRPFLLDRPAAKGAARPGAALALAATGRLVKDFTPADVLAPDVLDFFINRMHAAERAEVGEAVATAGEAIRASRFGAAIEALPGQPDGLSVAFLKGLALFGQGQLEPAAEQFRASLRIANEFLPAVFYLGACYAAGGVDREAVGAWQTSLVSESDLRIVYEVLADALVRLGDGPQAEAIVTEAQRRWPDVDVFASRLAAAHAVQNRRDDALAVLGPYLERHSNDTEALFLAIRLLYEAYDSGKPFKDAAGDRALAEKYGAQHREAGGANQALVARWISAMAR